MASELSVVSAILGGFIVFFGLISLVVKEKLYLSEAFVALAVGIAFGPISLSLINPMAWGNTDGITLEFSRVVIAIQVMATGVSLPKAYLKTEWLSLVVLLGPVMIWMWMISGLAIWLLIPNLSFLESLLIASCVTPTDPILANSIVKGRFAEKHVPLHVRNILSAESGANDGLGFPFLFLAVNLMQYSSVGEAVGKWAYNIVAFQILLSIVIGFVVGFIARKILKAAEQAKIIDKESFLVFAIALALFTMGCVSIIGSDDLLACFIAGNSFTWDDWFREATEESHFQEIIDLLLNLTIFVYIGTIIPWSSFVESSYLQLSIWRLIILSIVVLFLRRMPAVVALTRAIPAIVTYREGVFSGWFGPIGVGAVFYAMVAQQQFDPSGPYARVRALIVPIVFFLIISSVVVHGITVPMMKLGHQIQRTLTRGSQTDTVLQLPRIEFGQALDLRLMGRGSRSRVNLDSMSAPNSLPPTRPASLFTRENTTVINRSEESSNHTNKDLEEFLSEQQGEGKNVFDEGNKVIVEDSSNSGDLTDVRVYEMPQGMPRPWQGSRITFAERPIIPRIGDEK